MHWLVKQNQCTPLKYEHQLFLQPILLIFNLPTIHRIKRIKEVISRLKKNAPIPTRIATSMDGVSTIESPANADIMVPQIPANKQHIFCIRHVNNIQESALTATNIAVTRIIRLNTPMPNAIQVAVTMPGMNPNANSIPIIIPTTIAIGTAIMPQAECLAL